MLAGRFKLTRTSYHPRQVTQSFAINESYNITNNGNSSQSLCSRERTEDWQLVQRSMRGGKGNANGMGRQVAAVPVQQLDNGVTKGSSEGGGGVTCNSDIETAEKRIIKF